MVQGRRYVRPVLIEQDDHVERLGKAQIAARQLVDQVRIQRVGTQAAHLVLEVAALGAQRRELLLGWPRARG